MELVIRIQLDGAAFEDYGVEELARILESVSGRVPDPLRLTDGGALSCHDANGNHCGTAEIIDDRDALILSAAPALFDAAVAMRRIDRKSTKNDVDTACNALNAAIEKATGVQR